METLLALDHLLFLWIHNLPHPLVVEWFALWLSGIGMGGLVWWLLAIILFLIIEKRDPPRLAASRREAGHWFFLPVATATALSIFITELALKNMFARNRPPGAMLTDYSFPSGHATFAWALAVVLTAKEPRARYFFFLLAFLISLSRIYLGVHYPADVAAGSIIGLSIGYFSLWVERKVIFYRIRKKK